MPYLITYALIAITVLVSWRAFENPGLRAALVHYPHREAHHGEYYRLLTHGFVHADWMHLGVNMFVLFFFGSFVEGEICGYGTINKYSFGPTVGPLIYLGLYLFTIVLASVSTLIDHRDDPGYSALGASGAVSGATTLYAVFLPWHMIYIYALIPIPAVIVAVLFILYSQYADKRGGDNIGHAAHLWGAITMPALYFLLRPGLIGHFVRQLTQNFPL